MTLFATWKQWARDLKINTYALVLAYKDPRTPWYAKVWAICVAGYAFSPIDLIPDFIPVLGYLDDLILIPLGIAIAVKLIPPDVLAECREKARLHPPQEGIRHWIAAAMIVGFWLLVASLIATRVF